VAANPDHPMHQFQIHALAGSDGSPRVTKQRLWMAVVLVLIGVHARGMKRSLVPGRWQWRSRGDGFVTSCGRKRRTRGRNTSPGCSHLHLILTEPAA